MAKNFAYRPAPIIAPHESPYNYVGNDPINFYDVAGLEEDDAFWNLVWKIYDYVLSTAGWDATYGPQNSGGGNGGFANYSGGSNSYFGVNGQFNGKFIVRKEKMYSAGVAVAQYDPDLPDHYYTWTDYYRIEFEWVVDEVFDHYENVWSLGQDDRAKELGYLSQMLYKHGMPDMVSLYAYAEHAHALGTYHKIAANWITNGPEASFVPYTTHTQGLTEGWGVAGIGVGLKLGWSLGEPMMGTYLGHGGTAAVGSGTGIFGASGDINISYDPYGVNWITASGGIGISLPGGGGYLAEIYTFPLYDNTK